MVGITRDCTVMAASRVCPNLARQCRRLGNEPGLGRTLHIVRQLKMVRGKFIFAHPKAARPETSRSRRRSRPNSPGAHRGVPAAGNHPAVGDPQRRADDRPTAAGQPRTQRSGPPPLQRLRLEGRACRGWGRTIPGQRHTRAAALLRLRAAGCGREHQGAVGVSGAQRPRLHPAYLHPPAADQRTAHAADRRSRTHGYSSDGRRPDYGLRAGLTCVSAGQRLVVPRCRRSVRRPSLACADARIAWLTSRTVSC